MIKNKNNKEPGIDPCRTPKEGEKERNGQLSKETREDWITLSKPISIGSFCKTGTVFPKRERLGRREREWDGATFLS